MARWLNKYFLLIFLFAIANSICFCQSDEEVGIAYKEYKSQGEYSKFRKRSNIVGAWQINALKEGALVVRLKTNKAIIEALKAAGNLREAAEKTAETYIINKNTMMAYTSCFTFCKTYFILSSASDSLFRGVRSGIFLDSTLRTDPSITMTEKYYLLAERDFAYSSSIGFIREDSALFVKESGNPIKMMGVILKNKYGHQLKKPFPFYAKDKNYAGYSVPGKAYAVGSGTNGYDSYAWVPFNDTTGMERRIKQMPQHSDAINVSIKKELMLKNIGYIICELNSNLEYYFRASPKPDKAKLTDFVLPFLY